MSIRKISGGDSNLFFGFREATKIQEYVHSVFLHHVMLESYMDVGIVNSIEMLGLDELEDKIKLLCENLVLNKTEEAIDKILARTN